MLVLIFIGHAPCLGVRGGPDNKYQWLSFQEVSLSIYDLILHYSDPALFNFNMSFAMQQNTIEYSVMQCNAMQ